MITKNARIVKYLTFDPLDRDIGSSAVNADTCVDKVPPCLCAEANHGILQQVVQLRQKYPKRRIVFSKAYAFEDFQRNRKPRLRTEFPVRVGRI